MDYKDIFRPDTLAKLNKRSQENLKKMVGDKTLMQTMISSTKLLQEIMAIEAPYKEQLEALAVQMVEDMYPIILEDNINLDAKIISMGDVNQSLDEIKINKPGRRLKIIRKRWGEGYITDDHMVEFDIPGNSYVHLYKSFLYFTPSYQEEDKIPQISKNLNNRGIKNNIVKWHGHPYIKINSKYYDVIDNINENNQEAKRRVINGITQGAALYGTFSFYMFKEYLDAIDDTLVEKYNQLMKEVFGVYDDENAIAMFLQMIAQGRKMGGGSSKVVINEIAMSDLEKIKKHGGKVIDSFNIGNYELSLVEFGWGKTISLTSNNKEYLIPQGMNKQQTTNSIKEILPNIRQIMSKTKEWINKYGKIFIGSANKRNTEYYYNWLKNDFNVSNIKNEGENAYTETDEWMFTVTPKSSINEQSQKQITIRARAINEVKINKPKKYFTINNDEDRNKFKQLATKNNWINYTGDMAGDFYYPNGSQLYLFNGYVHNKTEELTENNTQQGPTIQARAICFPMLVHEIIKGLYELVSLQGFSGTKDQNQAVVDKVDKLENEPHDLKYGKFIYEALNNIYVESGYNDPRIREFFFAEVYQLGDQEFVEFIENALNDELTSPQKSWVKQTLKEIQMDLRDDDFDATGLDEIKINNPKYPYFDKWKEDVIEDFDGHEDFDKTEFNQITDPYRAIQYLRFYNHFVDSDEVIEPNINYIKYGEYLDESKSSIWDSYKKQRNKIKNSKKVNNYIPIK